MRKSILFYSSCFLLGCGIGFIFSEGIKDEASPQFNHATQAEKDTRLRLVIQSMNDDWSKLTPAEKDAAINYPD